jgi:hypothetical protein
MLKFNVHPLLKLNGAKTAGSYLYERGISLGRARHVVKKDVKVVAVSTIEQLCHLFNCTPNELFVYDESEGKPLAENSALRKLIPSVVPTIPELFAGLSAEEAKGIMNKIAEMKREKTSSV